MRERNIETAIYRKIQHEVGAERFIRQLSRRVENLVERFWTLPSACQVSKPAGVRNRRHQLRGSYPPDRRLEYWMFEVETIYGTTQNHQCSPGIVTHVCTTKQAASPQRYFA